MFGPTTPAWKRSCNGRGECCECYGDGGGNDGESGDGDGDGAGDWDCGMG